MSVLYELVGRTVVGFIRRRYAHQIRAAGAFAVVASAIGAGAYLASREDSARDDA